MSEVYFFIKHAYFWEIVSMTQFCCSCLYETDLNVKGNFVLFDLDHVSYNANLQNDTPIAKFFPYRNPNLLWQKNVTIMALVCFVDRQEGLKEISCVVGNFFSSPIQTHGHESAWDLLQNFGGTLWQTLQLLVIEGMVLRSLELICTHMLLVLPSGTGDSRFYCLPLDSQRPQLDHVSHLLI